MPTATINRADLAFRVEPKPLATVTAWVAKRIPTRLVNPVLGGILLDVADGRLTVSGFDYDVSTTATIDVVADVPGRVLVSGRLLAELVKNLPNKPVDVALDGAKLTVKCGTVKIGLPTMPVEDYPTLPAMPDPVGTVDAAAFADAVERVAPAAGGDKELALLRGVNLRAAGDTATLWASDRYRAAIATVPWSPAGDDDVDVLVPADVLADAARSLDAGGEVTVAVGDGLIGLAGGGRSITARLIAEKYPNLPALFPPRSDALAVVQVADLVAALKRAALVRGALEPVHLEFGPDTVTVQAAGEVTGADTGEVVDIEYAGEPIRIGINPDRLADRLAALRSPTAEISLTDPRKAIVLTAPGVDPDAHRHLVMPISSR